MSIGAGAAGAGTFCIFYIFYTFFIKLQPGVALIVSQQQLGLCFAAVGGSLSWVLTHGTRVDGQRCQNCGGCFSVAGPGPLCLTADSATRQRSTGGPLPRHTC